MFIEVSGTSTWNKGAELMMVAIREHFKDHHPNVRLAVDAGFGKYEDRAKYGLWYNPRIKKFGRSLISLKLSPRSFMRTMGIINEREIYALLDASGFAFGDQHPTERAKRFADQVADAKRSGQKVILLPQALGLFEKPAIRDAFSRIVRYSDLIYARDSISLQDIQDIIGHDNRVRPAPDFTNLVKPKLSFGTDKSRRVCIVPHQRMIEKANSKKEADRYLPLLASFIRFASEANLEATLMVHGKEDRPLETFA